MKTAAALVVAFLVAVSSMSTAHATDKETQDEIARIKAACLKQWTDEDGTNWVLVQVCIKSQTQAYQDFRNGTESK